VKNVLNPVVSEIRNTRILRNFWHRVIAPEPKVEGSSRMRFPSDRSHFQVLPTQLQYEASKLVQFRVGNRVAKNELAVMHNQ
jgi:hypothetical protein